ncbi:MAG: hypothetical protein M0Z99_19540 [Betaproteobacteria bacterium]|nr:hypothetical protein [Betaproteobacteria bacterium]
MQVGDVVCSAAPEKENEKSERFVVLDLRGDRTLVEFVCGTADLAVESTATTCSLPPTNESNEIQGMQP